jgi:hypothetical protein
MTKYLISFPSTGMQDIPEEDMPEVGRAAHAVVQELRGAGVYVFTGGMEERARLRSQWLLTGRSLAVPTRSEV